jgi:hypothetical protein
MQNSKLPKPIPNLLVLIALTGAILFGWLAGHILRFSIPDYQLQHPPIPKFDPHIKNGYEFELQGIRRLVVLTGGSTMSIFSDTGGVSLEGLLTEQCLSTTYYTSLPAKCHSVNGDLIRVGEGGPNIMFFSPNK